MKRELSRYILAFVMGVVALTTIAGCKKEKEDEELPSLGGTLYFKADSYIKPGTTIKLVPSGVFHPEEKPVGYAWSFSWDKTNDTTKFLTDSPDKTGEKVITLPKEIGTYTIKCIAFADGYYTTTATKEVVLVKDDLNVSLTGTGIRPSNPSVIDSRDGRKYYMAKIGDLEWMRHNLAYAGVGVPYRNSPVVAGIFGQYYLYEEALKACPEGWRLPTSDDWANLGLALTGQKQGPLDTWKGIAGDMMADAYFHDRKMWEYWPEVKITNSSRFSAISAGYAVDENETTFTMRSFATFWTADSHDDNTAIYRYINAAKPDVFVGLGDKGSFRASVRCVRDAK